MNIENQHHIPVLTTEFLEYGFPSDGRIFVDGTFGLGGHSKLLLEKYPHIEKIIGIDRDPETLEKTELKKNAKIELINGSFSMLEEYLKMLGISGVDGILLDLGISSWQIDNSERGFAFSQKGPLDMRMNRSSGKTAAQIVNTFSAEELANIFYQYGEEKLSRRIASKIVYLRSKKPFESTEELSQAVIAALPPGAGRNSRIHPATRVFMALRIAVNHELEELENVITGAINSLNPGGRLSIISFHSLEDRIVKNAFQIASGKCLCPPGLPECRCGNKAIIKIITRKPITPNSKEENENPRSRSAKMRIAEKLS
ncbi:MAG: 16S rRNA (cytosine(1402)-N(4))-methyltransferase RsmH [Candidatus Riflebacteria bacterium]|nr:16S rRNA (cytosine(1402)-N(4))-methyltransferase RsmH [Candidatus Riflebacteria bacterium]